MSDEERPLPAHLQALLDHERTPPPLDETRRDAIRRNVESSLEAPPAAPAPSPPAPTPSAPSGLLRTLGTLIVGGAIGAGAYAALVPRDVVTITAPPPVASPPAASVEVPPVPVPVPVPVPEVASAPRLPRALTTDKPLAPATASAPVATAPSSVPTEPLEVRTSALAEERALVERARAAIARRDSLSALEALSEHARVFADGKLAEEREALLVQALAANGRTDDARRKAAAFRARYPQSVFGTRVDATIRELDAR